MAGLQPVRGTHDLLPEESRCHRHILDTARLWAERYGFQEIATPIFEFTEVFKRTLGETSDVVSKEMYTFTDRSGDAITLRPEGTAGVARAFISGGMAQQVPCKFLYSGPMFRHERPQKGRLRQFHQVGVELIGVATPQGDIESIALAWDFLGGLALSGTLTLEINTLGDQDSRAAYREALVDYFKQHQDRLSEDSRQRLDRNPLRILDSKDEGDRDIVAEAPVFSDYLNAESEAFFAAVTDGLSALDIPFTLNPRLVRGLDYYCHTAFEVTTDALGAQGTVLAGGRYDGLIAAMGGPQIPGVGWAAGIERLAMLAADPPAPRRPVVLVPLGDAPSRHAPFGYAMGLARELRRAGLRVEMGYSGNMTKRLKQANKLQARHAVILGEDELAQGVAAVRDLDTGDQQNVALTDLASFLGATSS